MQISNDKKKHSNRCHFDKLENVSIKAIALLCKYSVTRNGNTIRMLNIVVSFAAINSTASSLSQLSLSAGENIKYHNNKERFRLLSVPLSIRVEKVMRMIHLPRLNMRNKDYSYIRTRMRNSTLKSFQEHGMKRALSQRKPNQEGGLK